MSRAHFSSGASASSVSHGVGPLKIDPPFVTEAPQGHGRLVRGINDVGVDEEQERREVVRRWGGGHEQHGNPRVREATHLSTRADALTPPCARARADDCEVIHGGGALGVRVGLGLESFAQLDLFGSERVLGPADVGRFGPEWQVVVFGGLLGFGEGPVEGGDRRGRPWGPAEQPVSVRLIMNGEG